MHQATNICAAATKKSSPSSVRKEKTKERDTPDSPSTKAIHFGKPNQMSRALILKRKVMLRLTAGSSAETEGECLPKHIDQ